MQAHEVPLDPQSSSLRHGSQKVPPAIAQVAALGTHAPRPRSHWFSGAQSRVAAHVRAQRVSPANATHFCPSTREQSRSVVHGVA